MTNEKAALAQLTANVAQVSETYAQRCAVERDRDWYVLKIAEEAGELVAAFLKTTHRGRREGIPDAALKQSLEDEAADVFAQLLLFARAHDIDLIDALNRKWFRYL